MMTIINTIIKKSVLLSLVGSLLLLSYGCQLPQRVSRNLTPPDDIARLDTLSPYLKVHMYDGHLYVLEDWTHDGAAGLIYGQGVRYDANRNRVSGGHYTLSIDSVSLFETNQVLPGKTSPVITVLAIASAGLWVFCIPEKACFGSCPTFYSGTGENRTLLAEGFSASVAPRLEAIDIDALHGVEFDGQTAILEMVNEALETHMVRQANLMIFPGEAGNIYADGDGRFWSVESQVSLDHCTAPEGDCLEALHTRDFSERYSFTDQDDLGARETIEITFENMPTGPLGLVISSRQTLLTTYLFYQGLAYMGDGAPGIMTELHWRESAPKNRLGGVTEALGGLEIMAELDGQWQTIGTDYETGPIATDTRIVLLDLPIGYMRQPLMLRLKMAKGHIRLNHVELVEIAGEVQPDRIPPSRVFHDGALDREAGEVLRRRDRFLMTMPDDHYRIEYDLPEGTGSENLFLESQGYYMEWMRESWLDEKNLLALREMFHHPEKALKRLAPSYKAVEGRMDELFWGSSYESNAVR